MLIPQDKENAAKVFHIHGWCSDGSPLRRVGLNWIGFSGQGRTFLKVVLSMQVGETRKLAFRTIAGEIKYDVERVA